MRKVFMTLLLGCSLFMGGLLSLDNAFQVAAAAEVDESKLDGLKCFIMVRKDIKGKKVVDYKDGKLFLCCSSCVKKMDRDPGKYEAKANYQLVYTGQYRQHACPFTGKEVTSESPQVEVDGGPLGVVEVKVCSDEMVEQLDAMEFGDQVKAVFGPKGFETGQFSAE